MRRFALLAFAVGLLVPGVAQASPNHTTDPYHYIGYGSPITDNFYDGVEATLKVVNPGGVSHGGSGDVSDFVAAWVIVEGPGHFTQVGWAEVSWRSDVRQLFSFSSLDGTWRFFGGNLATGSTVRVRVFNTMGGNTLVQQFSGGSWATLYTYGGPDCLVNGCEAEAQVEIYTTDPGHPTLGTGVVASAMKVYVDNPRVNGWEPWIALYYPNVIAAASEPYILCIQNQWQKFTALSSGAC